MNKLTIALETQEHAVSLQRQRCMTCVATACVRSARVLLCMTLRKKQSRVLMVRFVCAELIDVRGDGPRAQCARAAEIEMRIDCKISVYRAQGARINVTIALAPPQKQLKKNRNKRHK
jgi:hypothetical protein